MKRILTVFLLTTTTFVGNGQTQTIIDSDKVHLKGSLDGKVVLLSYIERGGQNRDAIWITYDRRPGVDPWIKEAIDRDRRYSEQVFIEYWKERDIRILAAITTYDDCRCAKHKTKDSPDMFLIHFKIFSNDWNKLSQRDSIFSILYNYKPLPVGLDTLQADCYNPRHSIVFYEKSKAIAFFEICFECGGTRRSEGVEFGQFCPEKMCMLQTFFKTNGADFGVFDEMCQ